MKKFSTLWILILIIIPSFSPPVTGFFLREKPTASKTIITVDDEPGDADYTSITEALNHANPGDTIEVYSGTYYEHNISITKERISLIGLPYELGNGSDTGKPFINGQGLDVVISIKARDVKIRYFRMENGGGEIACGIIGIWKGADNCIISDNDLSHSVMGCVGLVSNYNRIVNNTISHSNIRQGIVLGGGHNTISGNVISDVSVGIDLWNAYFTTVNWNRISKTREYGTYIAGGWSNTLSYNIIEQNPIGLALELSARNIIEKNNFINNSKNALFLQGNLVLGLNKWTHNYWDRPRILPYPIHGSYLYIFKWVNFDWHPAIKAYEIPQH
jgi:parallel beta-helix repeat protein